MSSLNRANLGRLPSSVGRPASLVNGARPSIVHIGVGGFHRSHMALYLDELLRAGGDPRWSIHGVGVLEGDQAMARDLTSQDGLYTLVEKSPNGGQSARVIGSITSVSWLPDPAQRHALLELMASEQIAIVSMTITEGGYPVDVETLEFDPAHVSVAADRGGRWRSEPSTAFGLVLGALERRRQAGLAPFTIMSCDNIRHNGLVTKAAVLGLAEREAPELAAWIKLEGAFPSSMVDRITPVTTQTDRADISSTTGLDDRRPVVAEDFRQWVLEEAFTLGRPPLEDVGVQIVQDVEPYELMKLRLLNAGHQVIGHLGRQTGLTYSYEAIEHSAVRGCLERFMAEEAAPMLPPVPGQDLAAYRAELVNRFGNRAVADTLARLCADSSDRIPKFLLGTITDNLATDGPLTISALTLAAWSTGSLGHTDDGAQFDVVDPRAQTLRAAAGADIDSPGAFLGHPVFGNLGSNERLLDEYRRVRVLVGAVGVDQAAIQLLS